MQVLLLTLLTTINIFIMPTLPFDLIHHLSTSPLHSCRLSTVREG
jgi:hypothetical protein